jgi:hypothetical protein
VLSLGTLACNATTFWIVIRPVRRLGWPWVFSVNAVATALAYLPFKLSVIARYVLHRRHDQLAVLTITTWFANVALVMAAVLGPVVSASIWRGTIDATWVATALGGAVAACAHSSSSRGCSRTSARGAALNGSPRGKRMCPRVSSGGSSSEPIS